MHSTFMVKRSMVHIQRGCSFGALVVLLLLPLFQMAHTQRVTCQHECIPLRQCPQLVRLLSNATPENIAALQRVTCSFRNREPTVCCPRNTNLLPRNCGDSEGLTRIVGGTEAPIDSHPWMAVLGYRAVGSSTTEFLCGGSVINERYILTAAHCVLESVLGNKKLEVVRLGEWDLTTDLDCARTNIGPAICAPSVQDFTIEEIIPHPNYNTRVKFSDDIALIRVSSPIDIGFWVHAVCLPPQNIDVTNLSTNEPIAAGWGFTENGTKSNRLLHVELPFVDRSQCNATYRGDIVNEQICVGGRAGQDSCGSDSGGPLILPGPTGPPYLQIGVVSYGPTNCGQQSVPGVYTYVTHYRNWIEEKLRP
ncbi:CLIP domain-containing serine protease 2-like [Homarus americanus]|uniref:CLIP domain-containing serine protease 2-like 2 n=1 Tax=Homarus americanus TaxID=6706 RepID=A0A8J5JFF9_HOMAM|nr:CLIP domain-containing serine protease 2-like [Homarus americanus]KAG7154600.1 CLIP domain-containing serine protease 2-like 2 [Homarus americanus]